ncbi:glycosyltransferase family 39 protein [candidate division KSB1 bacterium]|nr:glycosyltransferase family 39 protein [candidate division KSB1 bacterium]
MKGISSKWAILILCGFVVALRIAFILIKPEIGDPLWMDSLNYNRIAHNIMIGNGFAIWHTPTVFVAPLYPLFLAGIYKLFGVHYILVKVIQILLSGLTAWIVFYIAKRLYNETVGFITLVLFALHPALIAIPAYLYNETLNILLLCVAILFLIRAFQEPYKWLDWALAGFFLGVSTLVKGSTQMFPLFLLGIMLCFSAFRRYWRKWFLFFMVFCMVLIPWTVRNYIHFNVFLPVATGSGEVLWTGNYLPFDGEHRHDETIAKIDELAGGKSLIERNRILAKEAKKMILENPWAIMRLMMKKFYRFWFQVYKNVPTGYDRPPSLLFSLGLGIIHLLVLITAVIGMIRTHWRRLDIWIPVLFGAYYTAIHVVTLATPRYRLPLIPLVLIFSSLGISVILSNMKVRFIHGRKAKENIDEI